MVFIDRIKSRLHRDIVADPVLHGLVLNLYLNGEQYPHRVSDYFPFAAVEEPELERRMRAKKPVFAEGSDDIERVTWKRKGRPDAALSLRWKSVLLRREYRRVADRNLQASGLEE